MEKINNPKSSYIGKVISCFEIIELVRTNHCTKYRVRCTKCGEEFIKEMSQIKKYQSEGCKKCTKIKVPKRKPKSIYEYEKIIGTETSAYKIINIDIDKNNKRKLIVQCKKCGKIYTKDKANVFNTKGDGCNNCTAKKGLLIGDFYERYYKEYKNRIIKEKRRGIIEFNLSEDKFKSLISSNCHYCGEPPELRDSIKNRFGIHAMPINGIDRIDASKNYEDDNCVPCCKLCNYMKNDYSVEKFENQVIKIYNNIIKRSTTIETTEESDKGVE